MKLHYVILQKKLKYINHRHNYMKLFYAENIFLFHKNNKCKIMFLLIIYKIFALKDLACIQDNYIKMLMNF